jgi:hypothetical protein
VIYIPTYGEPPPADATNRFGEKVVANYNASRDKEPGGACYETSYARVKQAGKQVGVTIPALYGSNFGRLWGSLIASSAYADLPEEYRGKGAAGAMAYGGYGTLVDQTGIWAGNLKPGAVIQVWKYMSYYELVRDGEQPPPNTGHSFVFLHYVRSGSMITGMVIGDQGTQTGEVLTSTSWGFWVGANLTTGASP